MSGDYLQLVGETIAGDGLNVRRASELYLALTAGESPYARFIAAIRRSDNAEAIIFEVDVEVGQEPQNDIRKCERIAVVFTDADDRYPEVLALRPDFPRVPHLNLGVEEYPRSLCLYEERWYEVRLRWTAPGFIERIRMWLALTADGKLHGSDQPLEPILVGHFRRLILPTDLFANLTSTGPERLLIFRCTDDLDPVLIAMRPTGPNAKAKPAFAATVLHSRPQEHGVIRRQPRTLADLHDLVATTGIDLLAELRRRLSNWELDAALKNSPLVIIAFFPKTRTLSGPVEAHDIWVFSTSKTIAEVGQSIGIWDLRNGQIGAIIGGVDKRGEDVQIEVLNPTFGFSRTQAALLNGLSKADTRRILAIGAGSLGSQIITKLVRAGYGVWTIVDDDVLLPHNLARHELLAGAIGSKKAETLALWANSILEEADVAKALVANVLNLGDQSQAFEIALRETELIVDLSASVAVGRHLSAEKASSARRISLFLNPRGTDLIMLAEDPNRSMPLNFLEMLYYREVANNPLLELHLRRDNGSVRYAQSCRDVTSTVPEDLVGLHSAIGCRALRAASDAETASIQVWQAQPDLTVYSVRVPVSPPITVPIGGWTLYTDAAFLAKIADFRVAKLPNETGGVLIGHFDADNRIVYVVDVVPSPPDSKEWPTVYIRGAAGLRERVEEIQSRTSSMLQYVGEWHSHPDGYSCRPSSDDKKAFAWLTGLMKLDGFPAIMLIEGRSERAWYLGAMS